MKANFYWLFVYMPKIKNLGKVWLYFTHSKSISFLRWLKDDFDVVPWVVKLLILNMSLLRFGRWIGINMYYSIYLKAIFDNLIIISLLWSLLAFIKLFFSVPTGILDNKMNSKTILIVGKSIFVLSGILYFLAWYFSLPFIVILAIFAQGIATPMVFNTNQFLIRRLVPIKLSSKTFWLFFSFYQTGYLLAALLTAILMYFKLPIEYFFLIASWFSLLTLFSNTKTKKLDKHGLFYEIKKWALNPKLYKQVFKDLKKHNNWLNIMLIMQFLHGLMYYLWFMFIPLLAIAKDFSLIQIALLFAVMRIPHGLTFYLESFFKVDRELKVTLVSFFIIAWLIAVLAFSSNFTFMLVVSFVMSFLIATTRPMLSGMITRLISVKEQAEITWIQDFVSRWGEIAGYMIFWVLWQLIGLEIGFVWVAIGAFLLTIYVFRKKHFIKFNKRLPVE